MPKFKVNPSGVASAKSSRPVSKRGVRGEVQGWTVAAARRCDLFLRSVEPNEVLAYRYGYAVTLTLRDCPETSEDMAQLVKKLFRSRRWLYHWVIEWQPRSRASGGPCPHLHCVIFTDLEPKYRKGHWRRYGVDMIADRWLRLAHAYRPSITGQVVKEITDPHGWFQYLAKHAARGVHHYQRSTDLPTGWEKSGRMWGKSRGWPVSEVSGHLTDAAFYALRRFCRSYALARAHLDVQISAKRLGASLGQQQHRQNVQLLDLSLSRVIFLRRQLVRNKERIGRIVPISEWMPGHVVRRWLDCCCIELETVHPETGEVAAIYLLRSEYDPTKRSMIMREMAISGQPGAWAAYYQSPTPD